MFVASLSLRTLATRLSCFCYDSCYGKVITSSFCTNTTQIRSFSSAASNPKSSFAARGDRIKRWFSRKENGWKIGLGSITVLGIGFTGFFVYQWGAPEQDEEGNFIHDEYCDNFAPIGYTRRFFNECVAFQQSIRDPVSDKLLPDPVSPPYYQPPLTLVLEMEGILVHPDWTFSTGWRYKKRPALKVFLEQIQPFYEVVVYTQESALTADPVLRQIDETGQFLHYRLYREATRYKNGVHIKDLACLNRDLKKVILIEWKPAAGQLQPRNLLKVKRWRGEEDDLELLELAAFLRMMATSRIQDVRTVLDNYSKYEDPMGEFRQRHNQLMEEQARRQEEAEQANEAAAKKASIKSNPFRWSFRR